MNIKSLKIAILIGFYYFKRHQKLIALSFSLIIFLIVIQFLFGKWFYNPVLKEGLVGTFQEHDLPREVTKLISKSMVEVSSDGRIKPVLISGWDTNNDATIFKFKLKDNLRWSDGNLIKSSDLDFNIPNTEVSYPDDKTIQFKLKESYSPLPSLLTKSVFKKGTLIGTGPYKISKIEKSRIFITKIVLTSQDNNIPPIDIRFYPNEKVAMTGFNLGEVQALLGLNNLGLINNNPQVKIRQKKDFSKIVTILYNMKDSVVSSRSLRQALSYQAPKINNEEEANNPFPHSSWAYDSAAKKYLANKEEAKAALERAESTITKEKLQQEITLTATPNLEEVAKKIVSAWKELGFNVKLRLESGIPQNFQSLLITQSIPQDPDQYTLWHSSQDKTNLTKLDSKRVDKDLEDGRKALTEEDRKSSYFDFQHTLLEEAPTAFLYFPKYNIVYLRKSEPLLDKVLGLQI